MRRIAMLLAITVPTLLGACDAGARAPQDDTAAPGNAAVPGDAAAAATAAQSCRSCHSGPMSLSGRDADAVAATIGDIVAGDKVHPPVNLPDTGDAALRALAGALTAP